MSVITARGTEARENAEKERLDTSKIYLRLKNGESHKVRVLSVTDYVEYNAVQDWDNGIYSQPVGPDSPLVKAHKEGGPSFEGLFPRKRYAFVFASIETGELVAFDASKNQAKNLISTIEEYADNIGETAFTFKRTGEKTATVYSLNPKLKMDATEQSAFDAFNDTEVEMAFFESILQPNDDKFVVKLMAEIDPSIVSLFPHIDLTEDTATNVTAGTGQAPDDTDVF